MFAHSATAGVTDSESHADDTELTGVRPARPSGNALLDDVHRRWEASDDEKGRYPRCGPRDEPLRLGSTSALT